MTKSTTIDDVEVELEAAQMAAKRMAALFLDDSARLTGSTPTS